MSFFGNLLRVRTNIEADFDTDMVQAEEGEGGNSHALIAHKPTGTPDASIAATTDADRNRFETPSTPKRRDTLGETPFTPSKRQYCEVDESSSLRTRNHALTIANESLLQQQTTLIQRTEEASQLARQAEEATRRAEEAMRQTQLRHADELKAMHLKQEKIQQEITEQARIQLEKELKAMQLAQKEFEREMMEKYQFELAKLKVSWHLLRLH
jgi:hypothetical protein